MMRNFLKLPIILLYRMCDELNCPGNHCQERTIYRDMCGRLNCYIHKCKICEMMHITGFHTKALKTSSFQEPFFTSAIQRNYLIKNLDFLNHVPEDLVNYIIVPYNNINSN